MPRLRAGRAKRLQSQAAVKPRLAPIIRKLPPLEILDAEGIERIHNASCDILEEVGIDFRDPVALSHWREAGATVDGDRVRIDRHVLMDLVARAPARFTVQGRGADTRFEMGGDTTVFCPMKGAPFTRDLDGVRRSTTEADVINFCQGKLAGYKQPKAAVFVDEIPRNPSGKILKRVLREQFPDKAPV